MAHKRKPMRNARKAIKFDQKHPDLPKNLSKRASRTAWAEYKRALRAKK